MSVKLNLASRKKRHSSRWARAGFLPYPPLTVMTVAWLSQWQSIEAPNHCVPKMAFAIMIGKSCFVAIEAPVKPGHSHHCTCNHWSSHNAPQPHNPDASDYISTVGDCSTTSLMREMPFHVLASTCHHSMSAQKAGFLNHVIPPVKLRHEPKDQAWLRCSARD